MDYEKAIKVAIRKYKPQLEIYLDEVMDNETNNSYESEDSNDDDDEKEKGKEDEDEEDVDDES
ncbi:Hypothetical predicted protein [Mytilus galloprovincialis]|uniref:Uncharacterized protein n=1 Tax=Mytilus galloprovincialis TaxID=29158 RepID=A0A8B6D327_MYTGA|nr:Hypothetical predicted protein [Mytilus galloprovincialis]